MEFIEQAKKIFPKDRISTNKTILEQHSRDESYHEPSEPFVVVYPISNKEVSEIVKLANKYEIPIIPFGLGTSLEGHIIPYHGGVSIDFSLMNKIIEIRPDDFLVRVQPGVTQMELNKRLKKHGLFFSVDPGAEATLGGMAATNASGTTSVKYGIMRDQVRNLEVVLPNGEIIETGNLAPKSSSGYHLNGLFVGSEGTLGCFTELTLRVYGLPEEVMAARASFDTISQAVESVIAILSAGIPIARVELVDESSIEQVNQSLGTNYEVTPTLFLEFHGNKMGLNQDIAFAKDLITEIGGKSIEFETDTKKRNELWNARHNLLFSFVHSNPQKKAMITDVCLPLSELEGGLLAAREKLKEIDLVGAIIGHVGDGNFHAILMIDINNPIEMRKADEYNSFIVDYALSHNGTCTGEHGVGVGKMKYQQKEHGKAYDLMKMIKKTIDPKGIMNPGKVID
ncbi:FAD-binding oxidoreductase [Bacillus sp. FJAT-29937]|uniref:FAD-binding oxidoreductase n=1 Tax=Bacillus sp. FJAT-29937 TaxID=1720553 RepID=UPI000A530B02|nr:FAD-linked oxidase C-terminal domain-containing protein [Bacillus sp. FJAT-29937]